MAITNGYITLPALKAELNITSNDDDAALEKIIESASRLIDSWTGRKFYTTEETRYFSAYDIGGVMCDEFVSVTELATDEGERAYSDVWAATDYDLLPMNAQTRNRPYNEIVVSGLGDYGFPDNARSVKLTAEFGFCDSADLPNEIYAACMMLSLRIYKRYDTPLGIAGGGGVGTQPVRIPSIIDDPDIIALLAAYRSLL